MLDSQTKKQIDDCRNVLVGKVASPQKQIEQITIALIYKFMDDMDNESVEMGGKKSFFVGDYEKYSWTAIFDSSLAGEKMLRRYRDGLEGMSKNPNLPRLFTDIFERASLPYTDPATLKLFLKHISVFSYSNSEKLGDAFEYLLSSMGSQGDAGQFRTPRNIIDFLVKVIDPKKNETVLDPACGTAGFMISAFKHILSTNKNLTPDEKKRLLTNFTGYDIEPEMVRLSLVNLYLHGFSDPQIYEYDTLTSDSRWEDTFDVILANPPFMTPKGGIIPHDKFSISAKKSEVLFVDYIAEHLNPGGRAGIIVPEGIIFQSSNAYKNLRKMLIDDYLWAIISLPAGIFNPYSGVKTSILLLDKTKAKNSDSILFVKVDNDGFDLGAQRRAIDNNDLPEALKILESGDVENMDIAHWVEKSKIKESGDWNLSGERYRPLVIVNTEYSIVPIGDFKRNDVKSIDPRKTPGEYFELLSIPAYDSGIPEIIQGKDIGSSKKQVRPKDILLSRIIPHIRRAWVVENPSDSRRQIASTEWIVFSSNEVIPKYLREIVVSDRFHKQFMQTITGVGGSLSRANINAVCQIQIPLPPLSVQEEIVVEIDGYQKIIDGARQVIENYKPTIKIDPKWEMVKLENLVTIKRGGSPRPIRDFITTENNGINWIKIGDVAEGDKYITRTKQKIKPEGLSKTRQVTTGDFILSNSMSFGRPYIVKIDGAIHDGWLLIRIKDSDNLSSDFLYSILGTDIVQNQYNRLATGGVVKNLNSALVRSVEIPFPTLPKQKEIVAQIEAEQVIVNSNKKLIEIYEQKIKDKIGEVWGD